MDAFAFSFILAWVIAIGGLIISWLRGMPIGTPFGVVQRRNPAIGNRRNLWWGVYGPGAGNAGSEDLIYHAAPKNDDDTAGLPADFAAPQNMSRCEEEVSREI